VADWHKWGIGELRAVFARGAVSPLAYTQYMIDRVERLNPRLQAFIEIDRDRALAAALDSEARYKSDTQRPLEGIAIGVKANIAVKGLEHSAGMAARHDMVATEDAAVVTKLRSAGAIIIGTLNMDEAALGATTDNATFGRCLNPHGEGCTAGGSSGGSGAAVAAGLCVAALGTDTLGSIRIPASYCGVYGLKPTHGAISDEGLFPLSQALDAIGPLARSMDDISFLSNTLVAPDLSTAMQRSRYLTLTDLGGVEGTRAVTDPFAFALGQLAERPLSLSLDHDCGRIRIAALVIAARELAVNLVALGPERCARISPEVERIIDFALGRSAADLAEDEAITASTRQSLREAIGNNGLLILPTAPQVAFPHGGRAPNNQADWTALANIAGLPALTIPIGRDPELMPVGLQLIGPPGGEALLVAQARMIDVRMKAYAPPVAWW
jgi:aspartyl-tRNA(Asn)/glutamyl-tRNA(Gln) amidotransferase subunit A